MRVSFSETLRRLRIEKGISQQKLADMVHVERSTIAGWETGRRLPDAEMISLLSGCLGVNVAELLYSAEKPDEKLSVMLVEDERIIMDGELAVLARALPEAELCGFTEPAAALDYVRNNRVNLAFLDIKLGRINGLDVCRELLEIEPRLSVVFLTGYAQYALDAWKTGACGFLEKPLTEENVSEQLSRLRRLSEGIP